MLDVLSVQCFVQWNTLVLINKPMKQQKGVQHTGSSVQILAYKPKAADRI